MSLDSYSVKEIRDICKINDSSYSKKDNWSFFNYLDTKNITKGEINEIKYLDPSIEKIPSRAKRKVNIDDIIISTVRPNQEHYGMIKYKMDNFLVSTGFTTLTVDKSKAIPEFIYYYITQNHITEALQTIAEQSTTSYPSIRPSDIGDIIINLPPLEIQKGISNILSKIENKIEINKKINKNLTKLSSIIFINLMEKSNEFLKLNKCCKFIKGKKPKETSDYPQPNFLDYLTIDVLSNQSQMYAHDEKGILANEYDILMVMDGASSGKLFYGKSGLVGSTLAKLNVEEKYLEIVYQFLKQSEKFISDNTTGSAIPHTDKGLVLNLKCPISEELLNYSDTFKSIRSSIITNNNEILKLQKLRDTLLPKLMSGEIDVSKINYDLE